MNHPSVEDIVKRESFDYYNFCLKEEPELYLDGPEKSLDVLSDPCKSSIKRESYVDSETSSYPILSSKLNERHERSSLEDIKVKKESCDERDYYSEPDSDHDSKNTLDIFCKLENEESINVKNILQDHRVNISGNEIMFHCDYCSFSSKFRGNLVRHIRYKHLLMDRPKKFKCSSCNFKFCQRYELTRHEIKHVQKYIYFCYFCDYGIDRKNRIFGHIFKKHAFDLPKGNFDQPVSCYSCDYCADIKSDLLLHFLDKHKNEISCRKKQYSFCYSYPCELCSYVSSSRHTLIVHIDAVHKKIRPYACNLCKYEANKERDLRIHIAATHDRLKPYKCSSCKYSTAYKQHLRRHILSQHVNKKNKKSSKKNI